VCCAASVDPGLLRDALEEPGHRDGARRRMLCKPFDRAAPPFHAFAERCFARFGEAQAAVARAPAIRTEELG